jgi:hypothetical protein
MAKDGTTPRTGGQRQSFAQGSSQGIREWSPGELSGAVAFLPNLLPEKSQQARSMSFTRGSAWRMHAQGDLSVAFDIGGR